MDCDILELFAKRHSFYKINGQCPIEMTKVATLVKRVMELYPSPFNSQSARVVLLYQKHHQTFWNIVEQELLKTAPEDKHAVIQQKIATFAAGCGTILFYIDTSIVEKQEKNFPLYTSNFKNWGYQCNAILQFMIWMVLANNGVGASLQHYNPLIDEKVSETFNIPAQWELIAQMPFGGISETPPAHVVEDMEDKLVVLS